MVLGDSSRIPDELEEAFRRSGVSHQYALPLLEVANRTLLTSVRWGSGPCMI
jgi:hypothetical protein